MIEEVFINKIFNDLKNKDNGLQIGIYDQAFC